MRIDQGDIERRHEQIDVCQSHEHLFKSYQYESIEYQGFSKKLTVPLIAGSPSKTETSGWIVLPVLLLISVSGLYVTLSCVTQATKAGGPRAVVFVTYDSVL